MTFDVNGSVARDGDGGASFVDLPAPGKRTRTERLVQRRAAEPAAASAAPAEPRGGAARVDDPFGFHLTPPVFEADVHGAAARAIAGSAGPLPFAAPIQASFGRHDVGGIQAHTDGAAAAGTRAMGAAAFAMGDHVAFGGAPDLHTAAHEAAHVVQQRGGVQCKGGVGEEGDVYERHADEVADAVVAGRSAEGLLDRFAAPARVTGGGGDAIQAIWLAHKGSTVFRWDTLVNGLRWYLDQGSGKTFFQLEQDPGLDEKRLATLERLEGPTHMRTVDEWCQTSLFEPDQSGASTEVQPGREDLGPTTARGVPIPRVGFGTDIELSEDEQKQIGSNEEHLEQGRQKKAQDVLGRALATGYTLFDTAYEYGTLGALGRALAESSALPQDVFVVYKIKPSEVKEHFGGDLGKAVKAALGQLGRDYLDVLMLHDMIAEPDELEALAAQMKKLVAFGVVRHLGLSNVSSGEQIDAMTKVGDSEIGISFVQNKMHPHRQDQSMRKECDERGITYMGYSIMGSGNSTGKCGHVVSSETPYDVRKDQSLGKLAGEEGLGSPGELAIAWAVQEGTVQIPKTTDDKRMVDNRRAGRAPISDKTQQQIAKMDDVITDDDQQSLLMDMDSPLSQLRLLLPSKSKWHALDALYQAGLGDALDAIGAAVGADKAAATAFVELLNYVSFIDGGFCQSDSFYDELRVRIAPGDYSRIVQAFDGAPPLATIKAWWANAHRGGGCPRARTRVMGYIASGLGADYDTQLDDDGPKVQVGSQVIEVALDQLEKLGVAMKDLTTDDDYYATYQGKQIEFQVVEKLDATRLKIKITRSM